MGFGPLLVGYIFAVVLGYYVGPAMLLGSLFINFGLLELRKYCPTFLYAIIANACLFVYSFYESAKWIEQMFSYKILYFAEGISYTMNWIGLIVLLVFNLTVLYGVVDMSRRVEYPETKYKAYRNMVYVVVFNMFQLLLFIPNTIFSKDSGFFATLLMIMHLVYTVANSLLLLKCYAMICPEGEEDMHRKPSRFEFVNKIRAKRDEREQKAIESTKEYFEKKLEKRNQKLQNNYNKNKHHHKKKK